MARSRESIDRAVKEELVALARGVFAESLVSIVVYGSYLRDSFRPGSSDVNVLIVLSEVNEARLRAFGRDGHRLIRRNNLTPLVLTLREFKSSADVFPIEYLDIVESHRAIHGRDVTLDLVLTKSNLRHQVEHQLRGCLISLRQLAVAEGRPRPFMKGALRRELNRWYGSLAAVLRGVLRLYSDAPAPHDPEALIAAVNGAVGLESGPILRLIQCRSGRCPDVHELMDGLLDRLTRLVEIVDGYEGGCR